MEIERKFLIPALPPDYQSWEAIQMEQGYLSTAPVVRVRKENDEYYLTTNQKGSWRGRNTTFRSPESPMSTCFPRPTESSSQKRATKSRSRAPALPSSWMYSPVHTRDWCWQRLNFPRRGQCVCSPCLVWGRCHPLQQVPE